jgi:putative Mg2+ transporter-C (MgtC) family protein
MAEWWQQFWQALQDDFSDLPDGAQAAHIIGRLLVAAVLSGILGFERERTGKAAGLRTHVLVGLAAAFFVLVSQQAGMTTADISRVIQGIAAGIGFIGAGAILKASDEGQVKGLTTAAGLWLTTAVGVAAGIGREASAVSGTVLALITLSVLPRLGQWLDRPTERTTEPDDGPS